MIRVYNSVTCMCYECVKNRNRVAYMHVCITSHHPCLAWRSTATPAPSLLFGSAIHLNLFFWGKPSTNDALYWRKCSGMLMSTLTKINRFMFIHQLIHDSLKFSPISLFTRKRFSTKVVFSHACLQVAFAGMIHVYTCISSLHTPNSL